MSLIINTISTTPKGRVAIIDADPLVYRIGFACQKTIHVKDGVEYNNKTEMKKALGEDAIEDSKYILAEDKTHAFHSINLLLDTILEETNSDYFVLYLTGSGNFRDDIAYTAVYKGNRSGLHKPLLYPAIREFLITRHSAIVVNGVEADDAVSILFTREKDAVCCSTDKDLNQLPGKHFDYSKSKYYVISKVEGMKNFYTQLLTGDPTDNIKGLYGIGKKKAEKILTACTTEEECFEVVMTKYEEYYGEEEGIKRLSENGALLWMLRIDEQVWTPKLIGEWYD